MGGVRDVEGPGPAMCCQDGRELDRAVSGEDAVVRISRRFPPVREVDAVDAVAMALDLLERLAPKVPAVVHQADIGAGLGDQRGGLVERADDRPELRKLTLDRLEDDT